MQMTDRFPRIRKSTPQDQTKIKSGEESDFVEMIKLNSSYKIAPMILHHKNSYEHNVRRWFLMKYQPLEDCPRSLYFFSNLKRFL